MAPQDRGAGGAPGRAGLGASADEPAAIEGCVMRAPWVPLVFGAAVLLLAGWRF